MNYSGIFIILIGLFSLICGIGDFDFFMNNRKARRIVAIFGRGGARIFYIILGSIIIFTGLGFTFGIIPTN